MRFQLLPNGVSSFRLKIFCQRPPQCEFHFRKHTFNTPSGAIQLLARQQSDSGRRLSCCNVGYFRPFTDQAHLHSSISFHTSNGATWHVYVTMCRHQFLSFFHWLIYSFLPKDSLQLRGQKRTAGTELLGFKTGRELDDCTSLVSMFDKRSELCVCVCLHSSVVRALVL